MEHIPAVYTKMTNELHNNLEQTMRILAEFIADMAIIVWLPDAGSRNLVVACQLNASDNLEGQFELAVDSKDLVVSAFIERQSVYGDHLNEVINPKSRAYAKSRNWKSGFAVPLEVGKSLFGVLSVYSIGYHGISEKKRNQVETVARLMADSLQSQYKSEQIEGFYELARHTIIYSSLQETLIKIADIIRDLLRADYVDIYPWNDQDKKFEAEFSIIFPEIGQELPSPKEGGVTYQVMKSDIPLEFHRTKDVDLFTPLEDELQIESFWGIRLMADDEPIGVLHVNYCYHHLIGAQDREFLQTLAYHAATAVRQARLNRRLNYQVDAFEKLGEITVFWKSSQDVSQVLQQIVDGAMSVLGADIIEIYEYVQQINDFELPPTSAGDFLVKGVDKSAIRSDDILYDLIEYETAQYYSNAQGKIQLTKDRTEKYDQMVEERFVIREQIISNAIVPLLAEGQKVGLLFINYRSYQSFPEEQRNLIEAFAAQSSVAILSARKAAQLEKTRRITESVHLELDINVTLQTAINGLAELLSVPQAGLVMFDRRIGMGRLMAEYIAPNCSACVLASPLLAKVPLDNNPSIEWVEKNRKPLRIFDAQGDPRIEPVWDLMKQRNTVSIMIVPLFGHRGNLIGTIGLDIVDNKREFTEEEADLAQLVANQIAIAYENANLYEKLETINKFGNQLTALSGRARKEDIIRLISDQIVRLVPSQDVVIALHNSTTEEINFEFAIQDGQLTELAPHKANPDQSGKTSWIVAEGKAILNKTLEESKAWYNPELKRKSVPDYVQPSFLGVPMRLREGRIIGALIVSDTQRENVFDEIDQQVLEAMASHAAIAIENINFLSTLTRVSQNLTRYPEHVDEKSIAHLIKTQVQELIDCKDMYVALYDKATNEIRFLLYLDNGQEKDIPSRPLNEENRGKTEEILLTRRPILEYNQEEALAWYDHPNRQEFTSDRQPKSWLGVPMMLGDRAVGVIAIYDFDQEYVYDEFTQTQLNMMAGYAAIGLVNARLISELNASKSQLEALSDVSLELVLGLEQRTKEEEIMELVKTKTQQLTRCKDMYVALYDEVTNEIRFPLYLDSGKEGHIDSRPLKEKGRGKTEEILLTKDPILEYTQEEALYWYHDPDHPDRQEFTGDRQPKSWLGVPMRLSDRAVGVIAIYDFDEEHAYDEFTKFLLERMADYVAVTLSNRRIKALELFKEFETFRISEKELIENLHKQLQEKVLTKSSGLYIALYDENTNQIESSISRKAEPDKIQYLSREFNEKDRDRTEHVILTQEPLVHQTKEELDDWYKEPGHVDHNKEAVGSTFIVPMIMDDKAIGAIAAFETEEENIFDEVDVMVMQTVASEVARVLSYNRIYQENIQLLQKQQTTQQLAVLGTAFATLQHRINNSFSIIQPNINLLKKRIEPTDPETEKILDRIERNARNTSDIIAGIMEPLKDNEISPVNINSTLHDLCDKIYQEGEDRAGKIDLQIIKQLDDSIPLINAAPGQIAEVFRNLMENSCKAMKYKGKLTVSSRLRGDHAIEVNVSDTGPGIPTNIQERLFESPVTSKDPDTGSGLGLWLSNLILKGIGGKISVYNSDKNGTIMLVYIPVRNEGG